MKPVRQKWFGCSCCPPNVARLLSSLGRLYYTTCPRRQYGICASVHRQRSRVSSSWPQSEVRQRSGLPWEGKVAVRGVAAGAAEQREFTLALRVPDGSRGRPAMSVNGAVARLRMEQGLCEIERQWSEGDVVEWVLELQTKLIAAQDRRSGQMRAKPPSSAVRLCIVWRRRTMARPLAAVFIVREAELGARYEAGLLGGAVIVEGEGVRRTRPLGRRMGRTGRYGSG